MLVYTVAGGGHSSSLGDGGPATAATLGSDEGIWLDGSCNLYISDLGNRRIRKVNAVTSIITTIAGTGTGGYSGDGGPATNAQITNYGLYADAIANVYFADPTYKRIHRIDATTGIITTFAGGGALLGDNGPATNAKISDPRNVYGDHAGNIYIGEAARIRKVSASGIITTIAGTGNTGLSGDGGPATNAQINYPHTMMFDASGNFYFADRVNHRIRKISPTGIITTIAGTTDGFSGDGGLATAAQLSGPISFVIDYMGNLVIGDNQNNYLRKVDANTHIITSIAGVGTTITGSFAEGVPATVADIHPEFMFLDRSGNIYFSNYGGQVRKVTHYYPSELYSANDCGETAVQDVQQENNKVELYPNPASDELTIKTSKRAYTTFTITNSIGQVFIQQHILSTETSVPVKDLPVGVYYILFKGEHGVVVKRFLKE